MEVFNGTQVSNGYEGIHKGLELVTSFKLKCGECIQDANGEKTKYTNLIVESDSKVLIDMVTGSCKLNGKTLILVCHIQDLSKLQ